ncbi:MAG: mechanosensitive ion channel family protein [Culicoidibacterales bacterium]
MDFNILLADFLAWLIPSSLKLALGLVVLSIGWRLIGHFMKIFVKLLQARATDETLVVFLEAIFTSALRVVLILTAMGIVGLDTASLVALFASAGLAIGLAMQGSLSNFAGGVIILFLRPFKVGDFISDTTHSGTVEAIKIFYTELLTVDNKVVFIPNGSLANGSITNYTARDTRRLDFTFGISYQTDINQARTIINQVLAQHPDVLSDPAPFIGVREHASSSVNLVVWVWCPTSTYWATYYDVIEQVKIAFDAANVEIPFPQLDVHMK